jgi:hypothetical protein
LGFWLICIKSEFINNTTLVGKKNVHYESFCSFVIILITFSKWFSGVFSKYYVLPQLLWIFKSESSKYLYPILWKVRNNTLYCDQPVWFDSHDHLFVVIISFLFCELVGFNSVKHFVISHGTHWSYILRFGVFSSMILWNVHVCFRIMN